MPCRRIGLFISAGIVESVSSEALRFSGQVHVRDVDAQLNSSASAEDPLNAKAHIEATTAKLLKTKPGADERACPTWSASAENAARVPRKSRC
jgi:hypothetical protein